MCIRDSSNPVPTISSTYLHKNCIIKMKRQMKKVPIKLSLIHISSSEITFANLSAGEYSISFNTLTYAAAPFVKLLLNGSEMEMVDDDHYSCLLYTSSCV